MTKTARRRRWMTPMIMLIGGGAITAASAVGGATVAATAGLAVFTVAASVGYLLIGASSGDFGAVIASNPDERQASIVVRSQALAGLAVVVVLLVGSLVELARGP